ncbi:MAG: sigma-70 family RNA polymerase sigma factor [Alphaproteobacteria bacterium]
MKEFRRLIVDQIPYLRRYARALAGDPSRADDLVQDCLERAWSRAHLWRPSGDIRAWLFTIMHNLHANAARRYSREPAVVPLGDEAAEASVRATQEDGLELENLLRALAQLPHAQRTAVLLVGLEGMSYEEAAAIQGIPLGTLMSRLYRGRERLRELVSGPHLRRVK